MSRVAAVVRHLELRSTATGPITRDPELREAWLEEWLEDIGELTAYLSEWDDPEVHEMSPALAASPRLHAYLARLVKRELAETLAVTLGTSTRHPAAFVGTTQEVNDG